MPRRRQARGQPQPVDRLEQSRGDRAAVIERASQAATVAEVRRRHDQRRDARRRRGWKRAWLDTQREWLQTDDTWWQPTSVFNYQDVRGAFYTPTWVTGTTATAANMPFNNWDNSVTTSAVTVNTYQWTTQTNVVYETEDQRYEREANEYENALYERYLEDGIMPERDVFDAWWEEARKVRLDAVWQREKAWRRWMATGCDPEVRVKPVPNYGDPPYGGDQDGQERGFIRRLYGVRADGCRIRMVHRTERLTAAQMLEGGYVGQEVVWYRFEVPFGTGVPRFVQMKGRPTTAERRQYRRVVKRQEELRLAREEIARLEAEEQLRLNVEADTRALALLLDNLNDVQKAEWEINRYFHVHLTRESVMAGQPGQVVTYRIENNGQAGNVYRIENGRKVERFCIHPYGGSEPHPDVYLMQKLLLEENEAEFRRIANITRVA